ncbi:MAG: hypothetical protein K0S33_4263 [Bacteroidetes bacterium]|jgi:uncharacterized protein (TIGR02231 family)|nr:hypothetical protein [Bacteroidota bacterium]
MNRSILTLAVLTWSITAVFAGSTEKLVKSKPEKVTVYISGAQVFRNADVTLQAGQNQVILEGLEAGVDQQSIQAGGKGNFIITGVQYQVHYPELQAVKANGDAKYYKLVKQINDSLVELDFDMKEVIVKKEGLLTEKNVLLNNRLYKGESKKDSLELLKNGLTYLREKLLNINLELLKLERQEMIVQKKRNDLNNRLAEINNDLTAQSYPTEPAKTDYRIIIDVIADAATPASINVNYYVSNAGWTPIYDLRTEGVESPVKLTYKALVRQSTGADWKDVRLTLSTGNPHQSFTLPALSAWYLGVYHPKGKQKFRGYYDDDAKKDMASKSTMGAGAVPTDMYSAMDTMKDAEYNTSYTTMQDNYVQAEFEIKLPYTIPSDNKTHIVAVMNKELPTKYVYRSVPKLDMNAYLTARVTGWEDMNLLPGQATLFFAGTYVGQTYLNSVEVNDTLNLTLGQDKSIVVKREKQKDKIKEKLLDNDKVYTFAYEIQVKNGNAKNIDIEIQDQLPLSNNKQVVIEKENTNGASYEENTGILTWKNTIKAKDSKKINFSYTIKAPKEMPIAVR